MDIGAHFLGSNDNTGLSLPGQKLRSGFNGEDCLSRNSKLSRSEQEEGSNQTMSFHQGIPLMRSTPLLLPSSSGSDSRRQEHMLSFTDKPEAPPLLPLDFSNNYNINRNNSLSPYLQQIPPAPYRNSGYGSGGMMSMQGNFGGARGPFTLSQWAELEQQALIYKYISANVPVPPSLLVSIKKSFYPYGSLPPSSYGWGNFHLGFAAGNMDPEPGRCRRTDGKKWRCSRDAVPDQKYCERHINRGRHRSRKPVEGQSSQAIASAADASSQAVLTPQLSVAAGASSNRRNARGLSNNSLSIGDQYIAPSTDPLLNLRVRNPVYPTTADLQNLKQRNSNINPFEFGHISSDSLLNPNTAKTYGSSSYLSFSNNQDKQTSNNNPNPWSEEIQPDWTQLSMSTPIAASSSSSPSSTQDKSSTLSPLRLSREFDLSIQTEKETTFEEPAVKKVNTWIPISWGNSLGGPLGEVLNSTTNSPTGVLQKSTFCTLSNSSSVSSPIADNNNNNHRNNNGEFFHYTT